MKKFLRNTLFALAILLSVPFMLTACGEDEEQYNLEIHATLVGQGKTDNEKIITDAERTAFETKVAENNTAFQGAGAHTENEEFNINAPHIPNYKFVGWYEDTGEWIPSATGADMRWTMYGRDGYIEARYEPLCYNITYVFGPVSGGEFDPQPEHSNPTYHNCIKDGPFTLVAPTVDNYTFDHWKYSIDDQIYSGFTTLPTLEQELPRSNDVYNKNPIENITIYCEYTIAPASITITCDNIEDINSLVVYYRNDHSELSASVANVEGNVVTFPANWYEIEIFINQDTLSGYPNGLSVASWNIDGVDYETGVGTGMGLHYAKINRETDSRFTGISNDFTIILTMAE